MHKKATAEMYAKIREAATDKKFLADIKTSKKRMLEIFAKSDWHSGISEILQKGSFSCQDILSMCENSLAELAPTPKVGWLKYLYDFTISRMYPERTAHSDFEKNIAGIQFLYIVIRHFLEYEKNKTSKSSVKQINILNYEEIKDCPTKTEYVHLIEIFNEFYIGEFMRIGREIMPFKLLDHVAEVHSLAVYIAKQVREKGVPIDLALVSGAAISHDLGKFGCKESENQRTPYLHYYYTEQYLKRFDMPTIAHIAANHSTWDLELEDLSIESLILIYSDFRVKDVQNEDGSMDSHIFTLVESFDVILGKLDNVDEKKRQRYVKVYAKMKDFENYMVGLGIDVNFGNGNLNAQKTKDSAIMTSSEAIERIKALAIEHNIKVMNIFNHEASFGGLLEDARSENQWKNIRMYISILEEYSTHMNQKQKMMALQFMYETMMHREGDIRRQAASLMGKMIAEFDEEYRKELPKDVVLPDSDVTSFDLWKKYLDAVIFPEHKITEQHKRWMGYCLKTIISEAFKHFSKKEKRRYLKHLLSYYKHATMSDLTAFVLVDSMQYIPLDLCESHEITKLVSFVAELSQRKSLELRVVSIKFIEHLTKHCSADMDKKCKETIISMAGKMEDDVTCISYLKTKTLQNMSMICKNQRIYNEILNQNKGSVSEIFLENMKVNTPWIVKIVNIDFLLELSTSAGKETLLHIATHFSNLLKVSERVAVRHRAGVGLVEIFEKLALDERNEIVIELTKGLEIGEYQVSKYIPEYLGELGLYLHPNELDEFLSDLMKLQDSSNDRVSSVTLNTIGIIGQKYSSYKGRFKENTENYEARRNLIYGALLSGLANYREAVSQEAFYVIGKHFFAAKNITQEEKYIIFQSIYKKMLMLLSDRKEMELSLFNNAGVLNDIYRFISDYLIEHKEFKIKEPDKIAFFPGSFDPFTLSHKGIVKAVRDMGFEVYLALDEFSWSKKTQPRMIRRQIITMSIADESDVYVFPDDIPINLANPSDMKTLKNIWPDKEIYITVGSDVIVNASAYKVSASEHSIHNFNHIIFKRIGNMDGDTKMDDSTEHYNKLKSDVDIIELMLPPHLEDISSTRIRENIDLNRDISNLIAPVVQNFIYENSLYLREPLYKHMMQSKRINFELSRKRSTESIELIHEGKENSVIAKCTYKKLKSSELYGALKNQEASATIRELAAGKIVYINHLHSVKSIHVREPMQVLLTEVLAECLKRDFKYAIYEGELNDEIVDVLTRQGFEKLTFGGNSKVLYVVSMKSPIVILKNMGTNIKAPFAENERVISVIDDAHKELQRSLVKLYSGNLVLSLDSDILHNTLAKMIAKENQVSLEPSKDRKLGQLMCVPFGEMLKGMVVPNTVTKTLHTEKRFNVTIKGFEIKEFPFYSPLVNQLKTIKSFNRPILLLDDFMHKGHRLEGLEPIIKSEQITVKKVMVGVLSGRGKDIMDMKRIPVDSAYYVPNMRLWFVDTSMYPFFGGDSVETAKVVRAGIIPSINLILPYVAPRFLSSLPPKILFELSMTCLKNTEKIMKVLEEEYQTLFERNLTLNRLSEVISIPRIPERGIGLHYDLNLPTSTCVGNDIEMLSRLENMFK